MKKILFSILSIFVAFCLAVPSFAKNDLPDNFSFLDFSDIKIPSLVCKTSRVAPILDGVISDSEYPAFSELSNGYGVYLLSEGEEQREPLSQKVSVSSDGSYFYLATKFSVPSRFSFSSGHRDLGSVYTLAVSLGMTPGDQVESRLSIFCNEYYFSTDTCLCSGVNGYRVYGRQNSGVTYPMKISSYTNIYRNNGYCDADGIRWTADVYRQNAAFSVSLQGENNVYSFEARIPIGDVLLSLPEGERNAVLQQFLQKQGTLCGGFGMKFSSLSDKLCLLSGIPLESSCPYASDGSTWKKVLIQRYPQMSFSCPEESLLPLPLYLCGTAPKKSAPPSSEENLGEHTDSPAAQEQPSTQDAGKNEIGINRVTIPSETSEDESLFASLPDPSDLVPEDTQIVYLSDEKEEEEDENKKTLLGQILILLTGVLLFCSVIVFASVSQRRETALMKQKQADEKARKEKGGKGQKMKNK